MVRLAVLSVLVALTAPSAARAADVVVDNGVLRYTAAPGKTSNVTFTETSSATVTVAREMSTDKDPLTLAAGCTGTTDSAICTGVMSAAIDAGDGNDRITAGFQDTAGTFF